MMFDSQNAHPLTGFSAPVHDAQRIFRGVLDAMAHPGKVVHLTDLPQAPAPLNRAVVAVCLTLADFETPVWVDDTIQSADQALTHLQFHCGCPVTQDPNMARFALLSKVPDMSVLETFCIGTDERPDLSTTVLVQVEGFDAPHSVRLSGPGIKTHTMLSIEGVDEGFWQAVRDNALLFPRGVDLVLCADDAIVCLPRTIQVEV